MNLTYAPLLAEQRDLYRRPRDYKRFKAFLHMTLDMEAERVKLPTLGMNPMAKEHVAACLDALLAADAEAVGEASMREVEPELREVPGTFRVALVVSDDVAGGWTNRFTCDYAERRAAPGPPGQDYLDWLGVTLWAGDPPTADMVRERVRTVLYRVLYIHRHGRAATLRELLAQEGWVMARAGCAGPTLDADDLDYTRWALGPFLDATDMRTGIECLYGDAAGRTLGFSPRGLSDHAGLALALHDARAGA